ncbi:hypothetical protein RHECNPAF_446009 [Rhizobium etli CNPAF512]|nr:hypothetical protein RHECNPAF_446009 [Rhizobium etli CNPAF512]
MPRSTSARQRSRSAAGWRSRFGAGPFPQAWRQSSDPCIQLWCEDRGSPWSSRRERTCPDLHRSRKLTIVNRIMTEAGQLSIV